MLKLEIARGIPAGRIVLAGFSQGAAIAVHTGARFDEPLAGILALSMPVPLPDRIAVEASPGNLRVPIFLAHGVDDQVVPYALGEFGRQVLDQAGFSVEWHRYPMGHTVCHEEIADIRKWMLRCFSTGGE